MTGKEYMQTQIAIIKIGSETQTLDLDAFLVSINRAEAVAPLLDPTLFRKAQANMSALKELAHTLKTVKARFAALRSAVSETSVANLADDQGPPQDAPVEGEPPTFI